MTKNRRNETGQVLILLALGIVGLLGFTSLAIDGSMIYAERRHAQNAADTSAMAAALAKINADPDWVNVALGVAAKNGYNNDGATNIVQVYNPPISGPFAGSANHVQAIIEAKVDTVLVHMVYQGVVENTVEAVVEMTPGHSGPFYPGNALVGLNPTACDTVRAGGNSGTRIIGGGVFVNSNHPECAFRRHGTGDMVVEGGDIDVVGGWKNDGAVGTVSPTPVTGATQVVYPPDPDIPPPDCASLGPATVDGDRILPGNWSGGTFPPTGVTKFGDPDDKDADGVLNPQIFCINATNKFHLGPRVYEGHGVLFYMVNGDVEFNANAEITLDPPQKGDYKGLLILMDPHDYEAPPNTTVTINGKQESRIAGTIWGPASHCILNGNGNSESYHLQVVCYNIELLGTATLYINYDESEFFEVNYPPGLTLSQ